MFKASDNENSEQSTADCCHRAGLPEQSRGWLCPWRRGRHPEQQGRHRGGGDWLAGHVDQRFLGHGHQGQAVTQVLQTPDHPHLQVWQAPDTSIRRECPLYQLSLWTLFSPLCHLLTPRHTIMSDKRKYSQPAQSRITKSFYPTIYTIHSFNEHLYRQSISKNQSRKTANV